MLSIWLFTDGKRGHENQSLGLAEALARLTECRIETVPVVRGWPHIFNWLTGRFPAGNNLSKPDLILGAGHATHWPMLAARRAHGGKIALLMRPSLPLAWFDWVLMPEHDLASQTPPSPPLSRGGQPVYPLDKGGGERSEPGDLSLVNKPCKKGTVFHTTGPLNRIQPSANKNEQTGLMLVGGPSKEYGWSETALLKQIHLVALHHADIQWQLTTSRRTPTSFLHNLARLNLPNIQPVAHDDVSPDWLPARLASAAQVWITPDSASMVYEALSSGAAVGCFDLPFAKPGRVARGLEKLLRNQRLTSFGNWQAAGKLCPNLTPLDESERCAKALLQCLIN